MARHHPIWPDLTQLGPTWPIQWIRSIRGVGRQWRFGGFGGLGGLRRFAGVGEYGSWVYKSWISG